MASAAARPPVRISKLAGRYLLFDVEDVLFLRRHHNICSVFVGTTPQNPQQNIFMGLPLELMPEEARVLVDKGVASVVDDGRFHPARLASLDAPPRRAYVRSIQAEGRRIQQAAAEFQSQSKPKHVRARSEERRGASSGREDSLDPSSPGTSAAVDHDPRPTGSPAMSSTGSPPRPPAPPARPGPDTFPVTPTTSGALLRVPPGQAVPSAPVQVPPSYPLYAHLQDRGYYVMPGLRFGCDYNVYPGDPLRFHSHFQATSYGWDEEIDLLDLVAAGRLGTNVKKAYLIGGAVAPSEPEDGSRPPSGRKDEGDGDGRNEEEEEGSRASRPPPVRSFCIEWAGM